MNTENGKPVIVPINIDLLRSEYIAAVDSEEEFGHITVHAVPRKYYPGTDVHPCCPFCGGTDLRNKGFITREFLDIPLGKPTAVKLKVTRYRCNNPGCGSFNTPIEEFIEPRDRMSKRLKEYIYAKCFNLVSYDLIASEVGADPSTVSEMVGERLKKEFSEYQVKWPEIIGVDEDHFHSYEHEYAFIITDPIKARILDLWESRKTEFITKRFEQIQGREKVIACAMDMSKDYRAVIQDVFPNAKVVIDRFHVTKMVTKAMNDIRIKVQGKHIKEAEKNGYSKSQIAKIKNDLNIMRDLMLYNKEDLSDEAKTQLGQLFILYPELVNVYEMKEAFREIYQQPTKAAAEAQYKKWCGMFENSNIYVPYQKIRDGTLKRWYFEVFNYFEFKEKGILISNGPTEGLNNLVKSIMRIGRGYSFDVLRAKCVFGSEMRFEDHILKEIRKKKKKLLRQGITDPELLENEALREAVLEDEEEKKKRKKERGYARKKKIPKVE